MFSTVITSIQGPTKSTLSLAAACAKHNSEVIIVGDRKSPTTYNQQNTRFVSLTEQQQLPFKLAKKLPEGHYSRKNLGYLLAFATGAPCIYETDDDNNPLPNWQPRVQKVTARALDTHILPTNNWENVYALWSDVTIWPRGFPLDLVRMPVSRRAIQAQYLEAPIQQGLVNGSPDVDAVWRMTYEQPITFRQEPDVFLAPSVWCPFNSQNTWWWPEAYPLMYLPTHCTFRMTDIWRSFIAQRCLWAMDRNLVFFGPDAFQERNPHNYMKDFTQEIPGYTRNADLVATLGSIPLLPGAGHVRANLLRCYHALVDCAFFPTAELELLTCWLDGLPNQTH